MSGSTSVTIARFKAAFGFGGDPVAAALQEAVKNADALRDQLKRLLQAGLSSAALTDSVAQMEQARESALGQPDVEARLRALQAVTKAARARAAEAKPRVDGYIKAWEKSRAELKAKMDEARIAANAADAAIAAIPAPEFRVRLYKVLGAVQENRIKFTSDPDVAHLSTMGRSLDECEKYAAEIEATAKEVARQLAERAKLLAEIDKSLEPARPWLSRDANNPLHDRASALMTPLTQERDQLANAGPTELDAELKKAPSLLGRCRNAAGELGAEAERRRAEAVQQADKLLGLIAELIGRIADPQQKSGAAQAAKPLQARRDALGAATMPELAQELAGAAKLLADLEALRSEASLQSRGGTPLAGASPAPVATPPGDTPTGGATDDVLPPPVAAEAEALPADPAKSLDQRIREDPGAAKAHLLACGMAAGKFTTRYDAAESIASDQGADLGDLSDGEVVALHTYTTEDYANMNRVEINKTLEEGRKLPMLDIDPASNLPCEQDSKLLDALNEITKIALSKLADIPGLTLRGEKAWDGWDKQYVKGNTFACGGFWSTSTSAPFGPPTQPAYKLQLTIDGTTGKSVKMVSKYPREGEVLYPPGTKFRVADRQDTHDETSGELVRSDIVVVQVP